MISDMKSCINSPIYRLRHVVHTYVSKSYESDEQLESSLLIFSS